MSVGIIFQNAVQHEIWLALSTTLTLQKEDSTGGKVQQRTSSVKEQKVKEL